MNDLAVTRPLRADALRNRTRILQAARELCAVRGLDVTLDDIAEHAGLGVATVYRRFADRDALVEELFSGRLMAVAELAQQCLEDPDPWHGFVTLLETVCSELAGDKSMRQVMLSSIYGMDGVAEARGRLIPLVDKVVRRGQEAGVVRPDLDVTDVPVLFMGIGAVAEFGGAAAPHLWRRMFEILLDGLHPGTGRTALSPGLDSGGLDRLMASYRPAAGLRGPRAAPYGKG